MIYLYPERPTTVQVRLKVGGEFIAQYPQFNLEDGWRIKATPDGELMEPASEKRYSYLFWEASRRKTIEIDLTHAHTVNRADAVGFLDRVADAYALNVRERTEFVSYWSPVLLAQGRSIVQLLSENEYRSYAEMFIEPQPDTVIRLFMLLRRAKPGELSGNPELPKHTRTGFTVVEWGGANLNEGR